jgi:hypothetical protein
MGEWGLEKRDLGKGKREKGNWIDKIIFHNGYFRRFKVLAISIFF